MAGAAVSPGLSIPMQLTKPGAPRLSVSGGTGSVSEKSVQPEFLPDALESGTQNNVGIAGLGAAVDDGLPVDSAFVCLLKDGEDEAPFEKPSVVVRL